LRNPTEAFAVTFEKMIIGEKGKIKNYKKEINSLSLSLTHSLSLSLPHSLSLTHTHFSLSLSLSLCGSLCTLSHFDRTHKNLNGADIRGNSTTLRKRMRRERERERKRMRRERERERE
jgi:hypothetical protein